MTRASAILWLAASMVVACADDRERGSIGDDDTASSADGGSCEFESFSCTSLAACAVNRVEYSDPLVCDLGEAHALEGYQCSLLSLRDNVSSLLVISLCGGTCGYDDTVYVLGDGTAIYQRRHCLPPEEPLIVEPFRRVTVRAPEFFQACLDGGDVAAVACLSDWFEPGSCVPGACCPYPEFGELDAC